MHKLILCAKLWVIVCGWGVVTNVAFTQEGTDQASVGESNLVTFSRIDRAWAYTEGDNVKVAVLDWCFDMGPQAVKQYVHANSLVPDQAIGSQDPWHGEWMAAIVHVVAPQARIIPIRARPLGKENDRDPDGRQPFEKYLVQGIRYAADHGAVAVTNSMGPVKQCEDLRMAIDYAEHKGMVFINCHPEYLVYTKDTFKPCGPNDVDMRIIHTGIVSVPKYPRRVAPGRDIYTWPFQLHPVFRDGWGYSNAPPIVAGIIALMKSANPALTPAATRKILYETAYTREGFNIPDAEAAVKQAIAWGGLGPQSN